MSGFVDISRSDSDPKRVELRDTVERVSYVLTADTTSGLTTRSASAADREAFSAPIEVVAELSLSELVLPERSLVLVRSMDGDLLERVPPDERTVVEGPVEIELCGPIRTYVHVSGGVDIYTDTQTALDFHGEQSVLIGSRSLHESPAGTITTTGDPRDLMKAVTAFSGALKTTSPEVSFPTLRGHPPRLELGSELEIPESLEANNSDVVIRVPTERQAIYEVAPLAYYTAATIVPGAEALVVNGRRYRFEEDIGTPGDLLKRLLFYDTVVRSVGIYEIETDQSVAALDELADRGVTLDREKLYDKSMADRVERYLDLPTLSHLYPRWGQAMYLRGTSEEIPLLPSIVDSLALVREPDREAGFDEPEYVSEFLRNESPNEDGVLHRLVNPDDDVIANYTTEITDSRANWICVEAVQKALSDEIHQHPLATHVVCNESAMDEESSTVAEIYAQRTGLTSPVHIHDNVTVDELRSLLVDEAEYVHYVGHVTDEGFPCADGTLDAGELDSIGVRGFFLNGCASVRQGRILVENGAVGGIVTTSDVPNGSATRLGAHVARLLDSGFSLESAVTIIGETGVIGSQYRALGAGDHSLTHAESGAPFVLSVDEWDRDEDRVHLTMDLYTAFQTDVGALFSPHLSGVHETITYATTEYSVSFEEFESLLIKQDVPLLIDEELYWSGDKTADAILDATN